MGNEKHQRNKSEFFIAVVPGDVNIIKDEMPSVLEAIDNFDWSDGEKPKPFRNILISPILYKNEEKLNFIKSLKDRGITESFIFDSGGYQVLKGNNKKIQTLEDLLLHDIDLYNKLDWSGGYMMADHPPNGDDSLDEYKSKVDKTIEATYKLFQGLEPHIQERAIPIFHLRRDIDIGYQIKAYKEILSKSHRASFSGSSLTGSSASRAIRKDNLRLLQTLVNELPDCDIHYLGTGNPLTGFMMNYLGVSTYDSAAPIIAAGHYKAGFPYKGYTSCSDKYEGKNNIDQALLEKFKVETNHSCPFCVDATKMRSYDKDNEGRRGRYYRMYHNLAVMDALASHYRNRDISELRKFNENQYKLITEVCGDGKQLSLF